MRTKPCPGRVYRFITVKSNFFKSKILPFPNYLFSEKNRKFVPLNSKSYNNAESI